MHFESLYIWDGLFQQFFYEAEAEWQKFIIRSSSIEAAAAAVAKIIITQLILRSSWIEVAAKIIFCCGRNKFN